MIALQTSCCFSPWTETYMHVFDLFLYKTHNDWLDMTVTVLTGLLHCKFQTTNNEQHM